MRLNSYLSLTSYVSYKLTNIIQLKQYNVTDPPYKAVETYYFVMFSTEYFITYLCACRPLHFYILYHICETNPNLI